MQMIHIFIRVLIAASILSAASSVIPEEDVELHPDLATAPYLEKAKKNFDYAAVLAALKKEGRKMISSRRDS